METVVSYSQQPYFKGSIVKEYLLVVNPETNVWQQVMDEKTSFFNTYKDEGAVSEKPCIIIANFLAKEEMEEILLRWMHKIISSYRSFPVSLTNYSGFPTSQTVYIRVQDHQPFKQLAKELKVIDELVRSNGLPKANLINNPHMTIAKRLESSVYEKAMMDYSKKDFHAEFVVNELVLLKRTHQFDACKQVNIFRLQP